ncbi:Gti1/Pac2 family-domain-containing protein [Hyaloraphidium curvatum]|nr:Gti1/Pac2 family-domain-containing protein [Hyaloraphidium curvatum]
MVTETWFGRIESTNDALLLFEACRLGKLRRIPRRLSESERSEAVRSGAVFVWDEDESGIKRWTDGKSWSPSRIHGSFLLYKEIEPKRRGAPKPAKAGADQAQQDFVLKENGLVKKALSICTADNRRQHLVSYYTKEDTTEPALLKAPSALPLFADIAIPNEMYPEFVPDGATPSGHGSHTSTAPADRRPTPSNHSTPTPPAEPPLRNNPPTTRSPLPLPYLAPPVAPMMPPYSGYPPALGPLYAQPPGYPDPAWMHPAPPVYPPPAAYYPRMPPPPGPSPMPPGPYDGMGIPYDPYMGQSMYPPYPREPRQHAYYGTDAPPPALPPLMQPPPLQPPPLQPDPRVPVPVLPKPPLN